MRVVSSYQTKAPNEPVAGCRLHAQYQPDGRREAMFTRNQELTRRISQLTATYKTVSAKIGMLQRELAQVAEELATANGERLVLNTDSSAAA